MKDLIAKIQALLNKSPRLGRATNWGIQAQQDLSAKGRSYWLLAAFLLISGMLIGHLLGTHSFWVAARYYVYNKLQHASAHPLNASTRTAVVLIGDEEFWDGELARRTPLKRDYLACLLLKLDEANPDLIALDVDLSFSHPDYKDETNELIAAIRSVSTNRPVVVPRPIAGNHLASERSHATPPQPSESMPTIFDKDRIYNLFYGHVLLPDDVRQVPLSLILPDGKQVDSFAAAIAQRLDRSALPDAQSSDNSLPYGTFIPPERFTQISAKRVFDTDSKKLKELLAPYAVLVGGAWHANSFEDRQVDTHPTPVGEIAGVFVHANYVEALLTHHTTKPIGKVVGIAIEVMLVVFLALVFAWKMDPVSKFVWASGLSVILVVMTYVFWQNLGLFFDFFIPLILLGGHALIAQVIEWRDEARAAQPA